MGRHLCSIDRHLYLIYRFLYVPDSYLCGIGSHHYVIDSYPCAIDKHLYVIYSYQCVIDRHLCVIESYLHKTYLQKKAAISCRPLVYNAGAICFSSAIFIFCQPIGDNSALAISHQVINRFVFCSGYFRCRLQHFANILRYQFICFVTGKLLTKLCNILFVHSISD